MNKELIDRAWACLPREFKEKVKKKYARCVEIDADDNPNLPAYAVKSAITRRALLEKLFGEHNLTSDAEGEELLTCEKYKVEEALNYCDELDSISGSHNMRNWGEQMIAYLFGSKCLPDEACNVASNVASNIASSEPKPKPSEPKNEGTHQEQYVPQNAKSGTHSLNHILKDGFREHNRLHIAAMAMQGILSNADRMKRYEYVATKPPCEKLAVVVARNALRYADALITEVEKKES